MQLATHIYIYIYIYIYIANIFTDYIESAQSGETSHGARDRSPIGEAQDTTAEPDCCSTDTGDGCSETIANATVLSDEATLRFGLNIEDIVIAVLRALKISDTMCGSQMDFMQILEYGRDLYCKGDSEMLATQTQATKILLLTTSVLKKVILVYGALWKKLTAFTNIALNVEQ